VAVIEMESKCSAGTVQTQPERDRRDAEHGGCLWRPKFLEDSEAQHLLMDPGEVPPRFA